MLMEELNTIDAPTDFGLVSAMVTYVALAVVCPPAALVFAAGGMA